MSLSSSLLSPTFLLVLLLIPSSKQDISHCEKAAFDHAEIQTLISDLELDSKRVLEAALHGEESVPRDYLSLLSPGSGTDKGRIVGGVPADKDDHPWTVSVRYSKSCTHFCGGSLISPRWVVTVSHCIWKMLPWNIFVVAGGRSSNSRDMGDQASLAEGVYPHPDYNWCKKNFWNDIGLIKLSSDITVVKKFITLPGPLALLQPLSGSVELVGFGRVDYQGPGALRLNKIYLPVLSNFLCTKLMKKIKPLMFCAGEEGRDSCQGDSGAGAVQGTTLVGLVSHGAGCGTQPGVYTDVRQYTAWLQLVMEEEEEEEKKIDPKLRRKMAVQNMILGLLQCHGLSTKFT